MLNTRAGRVADMRARPPQGSRMAPAVLGALGLAVSALLLCASCAPAPGPALSSPTAQPAAAPRVVALVGGRLQPTPEATAIEDGVVVIRDGLIAGVGRRGEVAVPAEATVI